MKVLFLHQTFPSANEEGSGRPYDFAKQLVQSGHHVTIIAGRFSYLQSETKVSTPRAFVLREQHPEGFTVLRPWSYMGYHKSYLSRMITFITYFIMCVLVALGAGKFDLIVGTSPPVSVAIGGAIVAFLKRKPYVFEIRDLWSEVAIQLGFLRNRTLIALIRWVEYQLYHFADCVVINSPGFFPHLELNGISRQKIRLVPNGVDLDIFRPGLSANDIRKRYGLRGQTVAVYSGSLGMANDIDTILAAAELCRNERITFLLVGDGKERARLEQERNQRELTNVIFTGPQRKQDVPRFLAAADAGVVTLLDLPLFRTVYPNKLFDTLACGKPLILLVDGVARRVMEEAQGGIYVPPGNPSKLVEAIVYLRDNPDDAQAMGQHGRRYMEEHYDRWQSARLMTRVLEEVAFQVQQNEGFPKTFEHDHD